jgi:hypothetical protein
LIENEVSAVTTAAPSAGRRLDHFINSAKTSEKPTTDCTDFTAKQNSTAERQRNREAERAECKNRRMKMTKKSKGIEFRS